jgi:hypothetical protein
MQQQIELDFCGARINRDNGIKVSLLNAEAHVLGWGDRAFDYLKIFIKRHPEPFQTEQVRLFAKSCGFPDAPSARAWGGVMLRAARLNLIQKINIAPTSNPTAHHANAVVWRRGPSYQ